MQTNLGKIVVPACGVLNPFLRIKRVVVGIVLFILLYTPINGFSATSPPSPAYSVTLAWDASPGPGVTSYRIYYGVGSGIYTNSVMVENVTTNTITNLVGGITYFFAVTASYANGQQSLYSNEINVVPGSPKVQLSVAANRQVVLTVKGLINHTYQILASTNLAAWSVIGNVTLGTSGSTNFTDTATPNYSKRYYRTRDITP